MLYALAATREGLGIARLPSWYVAGDLRSGRLTELLGAHQRAPTPVQLLFLPSRMHSAKMRSFVDHVVTEWPRTGSGDMNDPSSL